MTLQFNTVLKVVEVHVHAKCHHAECSGFWVIVHTNFLPYLAILKNIRKSGSVTLNFDPWPWNFIRFVQNFVERSSAVYELSWSQRNKKKLRRKQCCRSLPRTVNILQKKEYKNTSTYKPNVKYKQVHSIATAKYHILLINARLCNSDVTWSMN